MDLIIIFLAKYLGYMLLAIFAVLFLKNRSKNFLFIPLISALVSRFIFTEIIRFFYFRPRPFVEQGIVPLIEHASTASFPSGHAAFYFALSAGVYYYNKKAGLWFFAGSAAIGLARVFAGLHYFTDILGGLLIALLSYFLVRIFFKKKQDRISALP
ncbi:MAG: phosphatase PAP2 family protein [Patescibacteria group bacterium]